MTYAQSPLDKFEQTIQASRALNWMIFCTHQQGDNLATVQDGIHTILENQTDILEGIATTLRAAEASRKFSATVDHATSQRIQREDQEAEVLHRQSARMEAELAGYDPQLSPEELREKFIADNARRGVGVPTIAEALNMKEAAVSKLVAQLLGIDQRTAPPRASGKAVNE